VAISVVVDVTNVSDTRDLSWALGTLAVGDIIVVTMVTDDVGNMLMNAPTATGVTFTQRISDVTGSHCFGSVHTGVVTSGGAITVAATPSQNTTARHHGGVCTVFPTADGYTLAATPNTADAHPAASGAPVAVINDAAGTDTIGLVVPGGQTYTLVAVEVLAATGPSYIVAANADWVTVDGASRVYRGTVIEDNYSRVSARGTFYFWHQLAVGTPLATTPPDTYLPGATLLDPADDDGGGDTSLGYLYQPSPTQVLDTSGGGTAATATGAFDISGTAAAQAPAAAAGSITFGGTATAQAPVTAAGSITFGGTATASAPATAAGSITFAGTATAAVGGSTAAGSITLNGAATAAAPVTAAGTITFAGTATGQAPVTAAGTVTFNATATAKAPATAAGSVTFNGTAVAAAPVTASGTIVFAGTATAAGPGTTASGSITLTATATARAASTAAGTITFTATATGSARAAGITGTVTFAAVAIGPITAVVPLTVTGSDRSTTTVTGVDVSSSTVAGTDRSTAGVTGSDRSSSTVTGGDRSTSTVS
jgi:hypothetical protein